MCRSLRMRTVAPGRDLLRRQPADALDSLDEPRRTGVAMEDHRDRFGWELTLRDVAELFEVVVGEHRMGHLEPHRLCGALLEQVAAGAEGGHQRHDSLLANRIDRRVGDLREELLEVVEEGEWALAQHRQRRVVAHRADGLLAGLAHGSEQQRDVLDAVAECLLAYQQRSRIGRRNMVRTGRARRDGRSRRGSIRGTDAWRPAAS